MLPRCAIALLDCWVTACSLEGALAAVNFVVLGLIRKAKIAQTNRQIS